VPPKLRKSWGAEHLTAMCVCNPDHSPVAINR
jgi:hypothetical protein